VAIAAREWEKRRHDEEPTRLRIRERAESATSSTP
jgi:hypothetical protein